MGSVVKSLEKAVNSMELQKITEVMDKFESQFEDLDVHTSVSEYIHSSLKLRSGEEKKIELVITIVQFH